MTNTCLTAQITSGGDERIALDPASGLNKYFCSPIPCLDAVCLSSCTASPISKSSFDAVACVLDRLSNLDDVQFFNGIASAVGHIHGRIARALQVQDLAEVIVCPSGTDAMLTATVLLAMESSGKPMTMVLPAASETGSGVPLAMRGRPFAQADSSASALVDCVIAQIQIALRETTGEPRLAEMVSRDFARAAASACSRAVIVLTHQTKTGLIAPAEPPNGEDVIVDACQARITAGMIRSYLARGWLVVVTGSKFYGGPAFSGAVLVPSARWARSQRLSVLANHAALPGRPGGQQANLGMMLRWEAALAEMEAFASDAGRFGKRTLSQAIMVRDKLLSNHCLLDVGSDQRFGPDWANGPTIFTFGLRHLKDPHRLQSMTELRVIYETLAREGVLLGQPVNLGPFGGLRVAVGARDARNVAFSAGLDRLFELLEWLGTVPSDTRDVS